MMLMSLLMACNFYGGDVHATQGTVLEAGGTAVVLEHQGVEGVMEPGRDSFIVDPNLARKVQPGDVVNANLMNTEQGMRAIGFKVTGHAPVGKARPVQLGEPFPKHTVPTLQGEKVVGVGQDGPVILTFLFTSCPLPAYCPLLAFKLAKVQEGIQGKATILAVTLDPENDSLEVLQAYGQDKGADPAVWTFGRVELAELQELLVYAGVTREQQEKDILHNLRTLLIDADGKVIWAASDNEWSEDELVEQVQGL
ncbi:MAG: SCO family protein [Myxococcota bacterium]|nr:SCO family protein [Myxococcota bacterium]